MFFGDDAYASLERRKASLRQEVSALESTRILNSTVDELVAQMTAKYALKVPVLHEDQKRAEREEAKIDVSHDQMRMIFDRSRPFYIDAIRITIWVPFDGNPEFFRLQPPTFTMNPPRGEVSGQEVGFVIVEPNLTTEKLNAEFVRWLGEVKQHLTWHQKGATDFNTALIGFAAQEITSRQKKLKAAEDAIAGLNIPLKPKPTTGTLQSPSSTLANRRSGRAPLAPTDDRKTYDCFVSYAGEDRPLVEQLVPVLAGLGLNVWWDKGQIRLGDRLSQKIDEGLKLSRYGLAIISGSFVAKRWPEAELRALANRAISSGHRVILPVLIDMDHERFAGEYPLLADIVSTTYKGDLKALADEVIRAID